MSTAASWRFPTSHGSEQAQLDTLKVRDAKDVEQVVRAAIADEQPLEVIGHASKRFVEGFAIGQSGERIGHCLAPRFG